MEHGLKMIKGLLENEHKEMTTPRDSPSDETPPVRSPFKDGLEECTANIPPRTRPSSEWEKVEEQVDGWLKAGEVEKSTSPFNAPHVVAPKATPPHHRLAQDFRRINELLKPCKHPSRKIDELIEELVATALA